MLADGPECAAGVVSSMCHWTQTVTSTQFFILTSIFEFRQLQQIKKALASVAVLGKVGLTALAGTWMTPQEC